MTERRSNYFLWTATAGTVGLVSLLFFPFAGFTEATAYVPGPIYRDYGLAGIGTYGQEFNLFGYPSGVGIIQILTLVLAVALIHPISRCWKWYGEPGSETPAAVRTAARSAIGAGAASVVLVVVALLVVFPAVEEQTIWLIETSGAINAWWPDYGAFVSALAIGAMAVALARRVRTLPASGAAPPAEPAPPPSEPPPPPPA